MQIQLKQKEIELALQGYIIKQGISLKGKSLLIAFTSGRSGNGLSADITIDDIEIPGFSNQDQQDDTPADTPEVEKPTTPKGSGKPALKAVNPEFNHAIEDPEMPKAAVSAPTEDPPAKVVMPVKTGVSLFN